jgi:hypothetical protein
LAAAHWLHSENWYLLDGPRTDTPAHWPVGGRITNVAFRDDQIGAIRRAPAGPEGRLQPGLSGRRRRPAASSAPARAVRDAHGQIAGVLVATVTTTTTERQAALSNAERKTVLHRRDREQSAAARHAAGAPGCRTLWSCCIPPSVNGSRWSPCLHPAFARSPAATRSRRPPCPDSFYRDPVGERHNRYKGRWLAGLGACAGDAVHRGRPDA